MRAGRLSIRTPATTTPVEGFAARELQRYLQQITGHSIGLLSDSAVAPQSLQLGEPSIAATRSDSLRGGAYGIDVSPQGVCICGATPRAVLDGVYAALAQLGCRWSLHGTTEEHIPQLGSDGLRFSALQQAPPMRLRGYCADIMTWHYTQPAELQSRLTDDRRFIDWMGKSGANTFFFIRHPFDTQLSIAELRADFAERGIDLEYGGHVLPLLLPRELARQHPEYFPAAADGQRSNNGNLCSSSPGALAEVSRNAVRYVQDYPEMSALHIWGADVFTGGWCHCAQCAGWTVQDQSLRVCNAVAAALEEAELVRPVCYLAYHDTVDADLSLAPHPQVVCEFAPRERCYAHPLNDSTCRTNRRYAAAIERYVELFAGRVRLFEYYGDAILYFGCAVPLTEIIAADMAYYRSLGITEALMLQFGEYSVWAYPLNFLAFAAACDGQAFSGPESYCRRFGAQSKLAQQTFTQLETILRELVFYGDIRLKPRDEAQAQRLQSAIAAALPQLSALAAALAAVPDRYLQAQASLLRYTAGVFAALAHELQTGTKADALYARALAVIEAVDPQLKGLWGQMDLPMIHSLYTAASILELR